MRKEIINTSNYFYNFYIKGEIFKNDKNQSFYNKNFITNIYSESNLLIIFFEGKYYFTSEYLHISTSVDYDLENIMKIVRHKEFLTISDIISYIKDKSNVFLKYYNIVTINLCVKDLEAICLGMFDDIIPTYYVISLLYDAPTIDYGFFYKTYNQKEYTYSSFFYLNGTNERFHLFDLNDVIVRNQSSNRKSKLYLYNRKQKFGVK